MIHVCSLSRLPATVEQVGARHIVTLINDQTKVVRPTCVAVEDHLFLAMHDIAAEMEGFNAPAEAHVEKLLAFVRRWPRQAPLVVHCWAGVSRSSAGAFITACALNPQRSEDKIAHAIRDASATASPNVRLVALADRLLGRDGRMVAAVAAIGPGIACEEGTPFHIDLE
jgi:predicted protein tyrosine phosphatase